MTTPGVAGTKEEVKEDEEELSGGQRMPYRGLVARANYLAQDRCDIQFGVKDVPTVGAWKAMKRLGRYLLERARCVVTFARQGRKRGINTHSDTD